MTSERKEIDSLIAAELEERVKRRAKDFDNGIENSDDGAAGLLRPTFGLTKNHD